MQDITSCERKKTIFFIGNVPPPITGLTLSNKYLLDSRFSHVFDVTFIDCRFVDDVADTGKFTIYKVLLGIKYLTKLFYYFSTRSYDIVLINYASIGWAVMRDSLFSIMSSVLFKHKTLLWMHGNGILDFDQRFVFSKKIVAFALKKATRVVLVGDNLRTRVVRWVSKANMETVHYGIKPVFDKHEILQFPSSKKTVTVLYFSNMIREKGWLVTLKAAAKLKRRSDIQFVFCGSWWPLSDEGYARKLVREWGIENQVDFRGKTLGKEKKRAFSEADIFVFPTFFPVETFGLVNLEAMDAGLPIITTSRAAIPEIVDDGINGFLIPEQDAEALAEKITYLADHPEIRYKIGKRNREKFMKYYTIDAYADRWIELLNTVVASPSKIGKKINRELSMRRK